MLACIHRECVTKNKERALQGLALEGEGRLMDSIQDNIYAYIGDTSISVDTFNCIMNVYSLRFSSCIDKEGMDLNFLIYLY